jgi:molybdenum cofactor biosynthesis protein B
MNDDPNRPLRGRDEHEMGDVHDHQDHRDHQDHEDSDGDHGHSHEEHSSEDHSHDDHDHHSHDVEALGAAVATVSSTRSLDEDPAGDAIVAAFEAEGHEVATREMLRDDYDGVQSAIGNFVRREDVDVVVTTGGTGVTPDDVTVEAASDLFEKELPGFGELFRRLSYDEIGSRVVGTRAVAGVVGGTPVFCLPGSENAARLGSEEIVVPEAPHIAGLAGRDSDGEGDEQGDDREDHGDHEHDDEE